MAAKKYFSNIDLNKNQIKNAVLENKAEPVTGSEGEIIFDNGVGVKTLKYYNGTQWQSTVTRFDGQMIYIGTISFSDNPPDAANKGDLYVFSDSGALGDMWPPELYNVKVEAGDFLLYTDSQTVSWSIIQGNNTIQTATDKRSGVVTIDGNGFNTTVSPMQLKMIEDNTVLTRKIIETNVTIPQSPGIRFDIKQDYSRLNMPIVKVYKDGQQIEVQIVITYDNLMPEFDAYSVTLTSGASVITGATVVILDSSTTQTGVIDVI